MSRIVPLLLVFACVSSVQAEVRMTVRGDGSKVIYNIGGYAGRTANWNWLARQQNRRSQYDPLIERYASQYRVDPVLIRAVIQIESDFNPNCVSNKGARGLMQLMPETARRYAVRRPHDPDENIRGGVAYLSFLLSKFANDTNRALAAYNAGEGAVLKYGGIPPYGETTNYVKRALTVYYGRPMNGSAGSAMTFAGSRNKKLRGGFGNAIVNPLAAAVPGLHYLGSQ